MKAGRGHAAGIGGPGGRPPGTPAGGTRQPRGAGAARSTDRLLARDTHWALQLPAGACHPLATRAPEGRDAVAREGQHTPRARAGTALASMLARLRLTGRQNSLTAGTCEARVTQAAEAPTWVLQAVPGMCRVAGTWATFIDVPLTAQASVSWGAGAAETTHQIHAGTIVQAPGPQVQGWAWATVILINLAEHTQRPWGTGAEIVGHEVNADAPMLAGLGGTLVYIILTVVTSVASWTLTHITAHVASAGAPMLAGLSQAGVHLLLTVAASVALWAHTVVGAILVHTLPTRLTQLLRGHSDLGCSLSAGQAPDIT